MKREVPFRRVRLKSRGKGLMLKMPQTRVLLKDLKFKYQKKLQLKRLQQKQVQMKRPQQMQCHSGSWTRLR